MGADLGAVPARIVGISDIRIRLSGVLRTFRPEYRNMPRKSLIPLMRRLQEVDIMAVIIRTKLSEMRKSLILFGFHQVFHTDSAAARLMSGACGCRLRGWRASAVFSCACAAGCGGCGYMLRWPWFVFSRAVFRGWPRVFLGGVAPFLILYPQQTVPRPTHHRDFSTWAKAPLAVAVCATSRCALQAQCRYIAREAPSR